MDENLLPVENLLPKAVSYRRVSGKGQLGEDRTGMERQLQTIAAFSADRYELVNDFAEAFTGTEEDRPAYAEMLEWMKGEQVDTVIVESLDRFARDLLIQMALLGNLVVHDVRLISASTGECVTESMGMDPMRRAMVQIQGVFAELERRLLVRKLRKGRDIKRPKLCDPAHPNGKSEGRKEYGYYPHEKVGLARITELWVIGMKATKIARILNNEGIKPRHGNEWTRYSIREILARMKKRIAARADPLEVV